jgi:hypothetical protein
VLTAGSNNVGIGLSAVWPQELPWFITQLLTAALLFKSPNLMDRLANSREARAQGADNLFFMVTNTRQ